MTLVFAARGDTPWGEVIPYIVIQCVGAVLGTVLAHLMFDLAPLAIGIKERSGPSQWLAEAVATFALVLTILGGLRFTPTAIPWLVGLVITAAYWFTASTSFVFDQHGVSFVSVTQQFNTTTSLTALTPAQLRTEWRRL